MIGGKIYQLVCRITGEKYVGSTVMKLEYRLHGHMNTTSGCSSRIIIERGDYYIDLLEEYSCNTIKDLRMREREWFDKGGWINKKRPYITNEEKQKERRENRMIEYHLRKCGIFKK